MFFPPNSSSHLSMLVFWVEMPCGLVGRYERFGGAYCVHCQSHLPTITHGVTDQKTNIGIFTAVRTSNLISSSFHFHPQPSCFFILLTFTSFPPPFPLLPFLPHFHLFVLISLAPLRSYTYAYKDFFRINFKPEIGCCRSHILLLAYKPYYQTWWPST
jgi:hypothetical protein